MYPALTESLSCYFWKFCISAFFLLTYWSYSCLVFFCQAKENNKKKFLRLTFISHFFLYFSSVLFLLVELQNPHKLLIKARHEISRNSPLTQDSFPSWLVLFQVYTQVHDQWWKLLVTVQWLTVERSRLMCQ